MMLNNQESINNNKTLKKEKNKKKMREAFLKLL